MAYPPGWAPWRLSGDQGKSPETKAGDRKADGAVGVWKVLGSLGEVQDQAPCPGPPASLWSLRLLGQARAGPQALSLRPSCLLQYLLTCRATSSPLRGGAPLDAPPAAPARAGGPQALYLAPSMVQLVTARGGRRVVAHSWLVLRPTRSPPQSLLPSGSQPLFLDPLTSLAGTWAQKQALAGHPLGSRPFTVIPRPWGGSWSQAHVSGSRETPPHTHPQYWLQLDQCPQGPKHSSS